MPNTSTMDLLQASLQAVHLRQEVYANNIANASTPGYQAQDVVFANVLNQTLPNAGVPTLQPGQVSVPLPIQTAVNRNPLQPVIETTGGTTVSNNGNNVDVEAQMVGMATNQLRYNALSQDIMMRFQRMQQILTGM